MTLPATITTQVELDHAFAESGGRPVVIFKNSGRCGISAHAYQSYRDLVAARAVPDALFTVIEVPEARGVSDELAARTGIRHETPQIIALRNGAAIWFASHWDVSPEALQRALGDDAA